MAGRLLSVSTLNNKVDFPLGSLREILSEFPASFSLCLLSFVLFCDVFPVFYEFYYICQPVLQKGHMGTFDRNSEDSLILFLFIFLFS